MRHDIMRLTEEERHILRGELSDARDSEDLDYAFEIADLFYEDAFAGYLETRREINNFTQEGEVNLGLIERVYNAAQRLRSYIAEMAMWADYSFGLRDDSQFN